MLNEIRNWLIKLLAKDMPVILNVNVSRPKNESSPLVYLPNPEKPYLINNSILWSLERDHIIIPRRDDHDFPPEPDYRAQTYGVYLGSMQEQTKGGE